MDRRDFIRTSCLTCVGSIGASWLLQACTTGKYLTGYSTSQNKITIKKSDFTSVKKNKTVQSKFVLIKPESVQFPIAVYRISDAEYKSVLLQCTHQGCELTAYETALVCPCHGAEFNPKGEVTTGPAEKNLHSFLTTSDNENIYIQL